jgi:hypothetical protein
MRILYISIITLVLPGAMGLTSQCPDPENSCMNNENYKQCRDIEDNGCKSILTLESCPLQFGCGDGDEQPPQNSDNTIDGLLPFVVTEPFTGFGVAATAPVSAPIPSGFNGGGSASASGSLDLFSRPGTSGSTAVPFDPGTSVGGSPGFGAIGAANGCSGTACDTTSPGSAFIVGAETGGGINVFGDFGNGAGINDFGDFGASSSAGDPGDGDSCCFGLDPGTGWGTGFGGSIFGPAVLARTADGPN